MANTLKDELLRREGATDVFLKGLASRERQRQDIARTTLRRSRPGFFSGLGIDPRAIPQATGELESEAARTISRRSLGSNRQRLNLIYETAKQRAEMSGADVKESEQFARQQILDEMERESLRKNQEEAIASAKRKEDIAEEFTQRGLGSQDQFQPSVDYESALFRSLFGLGGSFGTALAYNKFGSPKQPSRQQGDYLGTGKTFRDIYGESLNKERTKKYVSGLGTSQTLRARSGFSY